MKYAFLTTLCLLIFGCQSKSGDKCELELSDSTSLQHITGQFYRGNEKLYLRTWRQNIPSQVENEISFTEYFHCNIPQNINPNLFNRIGGWYATDNSNIYVQRPTSGGEIIYVVEGANMKEFEVIENHTELAIDQNYIYNEGQRIKKYSEETLKELIDSTE